MVMNARTLVPLNIVIQLVVKSVIQRDLPAVIEVLIQLRPKHAEDGAKYTSQDDCSSNSRRCILAKAVHHVRLNAYLSFC